MPTNRSTSRAGVRPVHPDPGEPTVTGGRPVRADDLADDDYDLAGGHPADDPYRSAGAARARADRSVRAARRRANTGPTGFAGWLRAASRTYGWRIYAVPVLLVVTVLVVYDATQPASRATPTAAGTRGPVVTEVPASEANLNIPTAELPEGGPVTQTGKGTWHVVPGHGPQVGKGKLYRYTVEIEDGIDPAQYGGDTAFAAMVDETLDDPKSWTGSGKIAVQRVDSGTPDFRVSLTTPQTDHRPDLCDYSIKYESSCYRRSADRVIINLARWVRGATAFSGDMLTYRQYAINHEVGHAFGNGHVGCAAEGALAPVMMQQSFGVANNFVAKVNQVDPLNRAAVPADGKTCKPNAWPDPEAKG